jgi:catechol 2,3-dioxygenase-like lactoylglutathione lyase family enzyme
VNDVRRSLAHYRDALGFEVEAYAANPDHYGYARRDACIVHFAHFEAGEPRPNSEAVPPDMFDIYIWVDDVDALHEELSGCGAALLHGPVDQEYGLRELRARDPDGYVIAFGRPSEATGRTD